MPENKTLINELREKDKLLDYYEVLISRLLKKMGELSVDSSENAKVELISDIALDFANSNASDNDSIPDLALQYIRCKRLGISDEYDAGRYSAAEDGFNTWIFCHDLCQLLNFEVNDENIIDEKAGIKLEKIYEEKLGWTPALRRIEKRTMGDSDK